MKVYLSGWQASNAERISRVIQSGMLKHRCVSFANQVKLPGFPYYSKGLVGDLDVCIQAGVGIMMDSGVFSYRTHSATLKRAGKSLEKLLTEDDYVRRYVEFCKVGHKLWDFYVTVDLVKDQPDIYRIHLQLEKLGIRPVPVFHGDDSIEYLKRYSDRGYDLVCIGKMRRSQKQERRYLDGVFNLGAKLNQRYHGLAITSPWQMFEFPFWSVDSSSWSRVAGYGDIMTYDKRTQRLSTVHISNTPSLKKKKIDVVMAGMKAHTEAEGFNWEELRADYVTRHIYNASTLQNLAEAAAKVHGQSAGSWRQLV